MPTNASPDANNFRCNSCGRYYNTADELRAHEPECRLAKMSTEAGRAELAQQDATPHEKNDRDAGK